MTVRRPDRLTLSVSALNKSAIYLASFKCPSAPVQLFSENLQTCLLELTSFSLLCHRRPIVVIERKGRKKWLELEMIDATLISQCLIKILGSTESFDRKKDSSNKRWETELKPTDEDGPASGEKWWEGMTRTWETGRLRDGWRSFITLFYPFL